MCQNGEVRKTLEDDFSVLGNGKIALSLSEDTLKNYVNTLNAKIVDDKFQVSPKLWYPPVKEGENPWIEWNRGEFPDSLTGTEFIEFLCESERDQREYRYPTIFLSNDVYWTNQGIGSDIVAYKVVS